MSLVTAPMIGDVTITTDNTAVFLRCSASDILNYGAAGNVIGSLIATKVGSVTASQ